MILCIPVKSSRTKPERGPDFVVFKGVSSLNPLNVKQFPYDIQIRVYKLKQELIRQKKLP